MRRAVARGRVFPQFYSTDRRYGRLSIKAAALFPLMWSNADDQGRLCGDPEEIKYTCCPNIARITKQDIPGILEEYEHNKLIKAYDTPKSAVIQLLDWWVVHHPQWAWPSDYGPPEGWEDHLRYKKDAHTVETLNWPVSAESEPGIGKSIYFILDEAANALKIGLSNSPEKRLTELQASNPHPLKLIKVIENSNLTEEQKLHQRFARSSITAEWFNYSEEIQAFVSGERSGESSGETTSESPLTTPSLEKETEVETEEETETEEGNSPESSGEELPSPSPTGDLIKNFADIFSELTNCFTYRWGRVPAQDPYSVIPREPDPKESAQLRDLAEELSAAGGLPRGFVKRAFDEAVEYEKKHTSYVRAVLLDWLGLERGPPGEKRRPGRRKRAGVPLNE